jgi:hypothetical protein
MGERLIKQEQEDGQSKHSDKLLGFPFNEPPVGDKDIWSINPDCDTQCT